MKSKIQFVYFDIGGVLLRWRHIPRVFAKKYKKPVDEVLRMFQFLDVQSCRGDMTPNEAGNFIAAQLDLPQSARFDFTQFSMAHFSPIQETHAYLKKLSKRIPIGLLTNIHMGFYQHYITHGHIPKISYAAVIESCSIGFVKPQKEIYLYAQKKAHVPHESILFIDDQPENIETAQKFGWSTILFNTENPRKSLKKIGTLAGIE